MSAEMSTEVSGETEVRMGENGEILQGRHCKGGLPHLFPLSFLLFLTFSDPFQKDHLQGRLTLCWTGTLAGGGS